MKRWGLVVAGLYFLTLVVLALPVWLASFWPMDELGDMFGIYCSWTYWLWIAIVVCGALLLLLVPIRCSEGRPISRRPLLVPIITSSFFLAVLVFLFVCSIAWAVWGDDGPPFLRFPSVGATLAVCCVVVLLLWLGWGFAFYRRTCSQDPEGLMKRATSWLLKGSITELIVAVCCHVVVRRRDDCCAPFGTFLGISAGLSVMLLSFGPGIFYLFLERRQELRPREVPPSDSDLPDERASFND